MNNPFNKNGRRIFDEAAEYRHQREQHEAYVKALPEGHVLEAGFKLGQKRKPREEVADVSRRV